MEKIYKNIASTIRKKRRELGITQEKLSEISGVASKFISDIERGVKKPSVATVHKLLSALNADITSISGYTSGSSEKDEYYIADNPRRSDYNSFSLFVPSGINYARRNKTSRDGTDERDLIRWAFLWKEIKTLPPGKRIKIIELVEKLVSSLI